MKITIETAMKFIIATSHLEADPAIPEATSLELNWTLLNDDRMLNDDRKSLADHARRPGKTNGSVTS